MLVCQNHEVKPHMAKGLWRVECYHLILGYGYMWAHQLSEVSLMFIVYERVLNIKHQIVK